jgi:hypothetical protein
MAGSISQQDFFGGPGMHYMVPQSSMSKPIDDLFHDSHLQLQEQVRNPVAFNAEMMGDIMYLQQAQRQPDAKEFLQAIIKEVNGHKKSTTIGHCERDAKSLRMSKWCHLYGHYDACAILQQTKSSHTRPC